MTLGNGYAVVVAVELAGNVVVVPSVVCALAEPIPTTSEDISITPAIATNTPYTTVSFFVFCTDFITLRV
jgi:hypothetical protein